MGKLHRLLLTPIPTTPKATDNANNDDSPSTNSNMTNQRVLDGINAPSPTTPTTPYNALPPIMESDAESSAWIDYDDHEDHDHEHQVEEDDTNSAETLITLNLPDDVFNIKPIEEYK